MPFLSCCVKFNRLFQIDRFVFLFRDHADTLGTGDDAVQGCKYGIRFAFRHCSEQAAGGLRIKEKIANGKFRLTGINRMLGKRTVSIHAFRKDPDSCKCKRFGDQ